MLLLVLAVAVAAKPAPNCSDAKCGVACAWTAGVERCHPQRLCLDAGAACAVKAKRLERLTGYAANRSAEEKACAPPPPRARVPAIARRGDADEVARVKVNLGEGKHRGGKTLAAELLAAVIT